MADSGDHPDLMMGQPTPRPLPQVFTRVIATPPGPPWRQSRMAMLEARQSAPLPIAEVAYRLRRLGLWDSRAGRFAAFYVRASDFTESFTSDVQVDGETFSLRMTHPSDERRQSRLAAIIGASASVLLVVLTAAILNASSQRAQLSQSLDTAERQASSRLRAAQGLHRRWSQATTLQAVSREDFSVSRVIADLNWVSANRTAGTRIEAFHWERGVLAVESAGAAPPVEAWDRPLIRSARPVRPGVWAWAALAAKPANSGVGAPVASQIR
jgi:hypothetical protein